VRIALLGLGNVLRRDDGAGPAVIALLEARYEFPPDVFVMDLGTPGLDLVDMLVEREAVIFVDAIVDRGASARVRVLDPVDLRGSTAAMHPSPRVTSHEASVDDALVLAAMDGRGPSHVRLVGIVAEDLGDGPGLSAAVEGVLDAACAAVLDELAGLGVHPTPREEVGPDAAWWRRFAVEA